MMSKRKAIYIALSVLASVMLWLYADTSNGTEVTIAVKGVPVEFLNEDSTLADRGLMLLSSRDVTVDLKLRSRRSVIADLDTDAIRIQIDLGSITTSGLHAISYSNSILYPSNISPREITVESASAYSVLVNIGELFRRNVDIRYEIKGEVDDDYVVGQLELLPTALEVRGQQGDVLQVAYAKVVLAIDHPTETLSEELAYKLYDKYDREIDGHLLRTDCDTVQVRLPVNMIREVPLSVDFLESDGAHLDNVEYTIRPQSVTVTGDAVQVRALESIGIGQIDLSELDSFASYTFDVVMPEGISNLSSVPTADVTARFKDMSTRLVTVTNFACENVPEGHIAEVQTSAVDVTVRGTSADLDKLKDDALCVVVDLSDLTSAVGTYTVPATVRLDSRGDIGVVGGYQVIVRLGVVSAEPVDEPTEETITNEGN